MTPFVRLKTFDMCCFSISDNDAISLRGLYRRLLRLTGRLFHFLQGGYLNVMFLIYIEKRPYILLGNTLFDLRL